MNFKPLGDYVLVKPAVKEEKTASGILLPGTAQRERPQTGTVVAVGQGKYDENGNLIPMEVELGDEVMFAKFMGDVLKINGTEYLIISERDIQGVFKEG